MTAITAPTASKESRLSLPVTQALWFAGFAVLAFLIPYVFTTAMDINHDLYYLLYFATVGAALALYVTANHFDLPAMFRQNWKLSLGLGVLAAAFVAWNVLAREDGTPRPAGGYFAFEFIWRGVAYAVVDAMLLSALPAMIAFTALGNDITGAARRLGFAGLALAMTIVITATYHLGYQQFRDDGVQAPETGNIVISIPTIASANPLGSIVAHVALHTTAVTHTYETDTYLPPQTSAE